MLTQMQELLLILLVMAMLMLVKLMVMAVQQQGQYEHQQKEPESRLLEACLPAMSCLKLCAQQHCPLFGPWHSLLSWWSSSSCVLLGHSLRQLQWGQLQASVLALCWPLESTGINGPRFDWC